MINFDSIRKLFPEIKEEVEITKSTTGRQTEYSAEEKQAAMDSYKKHKSFSEVEKETGVPRARVRVWAKIHLPRMVQANILNYNVSRRGGTKRTSRLKPKERALMIVKMVKNDSMSTSAIAEKLGVTVVTAGHDILNLITEGLIVDMNKKGFRMVKAA